MKKAIHHEAIFRVACWLRPFYDLQERLFNELLNDPDIDVVVKYAEWVRSCERYSEALLSNAEVLANATNNSVDNMKMLFRPQDGGLRLNWTPKDLLQVARYESFNRNYWNSPNAVQKNKYEFPE